MPTPKILCFAGSARTGSWNRKLLEAAMEGGRNSGAEMTLVDFRKLNIPLYDGDLEAAEGLPAGVMEFKQMLLSHQGLLIASPEYNSSVTPLLKNAIDWASRAAPGEGPLACFKGKVAGLLAASPGALGGLRGLVTLRSLLGNIGVLVLPEQFALVKAHEAFHEDGTLKDAAAAEKARAIAARVAELCAKLGG